MAPADTCFLAPRWSARGLATAQEDAGRLLAARHDVDDPAVRRAALVAAMAPQVRREAAATIRRRHRRAVLECWRVWALSSSAGTPLPAVAVAAGLARARAGGPPARRAYLADVLEAHTTRWRLVADGLSSAAPRVPR